MKTVDIQKMVRKNIKKLSPYQAARHLNINGALFLDANENPFPTDYNRYPDPWQKQLKNTISQIKSISPNNIFIGNGSDEIIDLIVRIFCEPAVDNIIITPPTYGMYEVVAGINNVECIKAPLNDDFSLNAEVVLKSATEKSKLLFLCSPNNPTGNLLNVNEITNVLNKFQGIVVIDEAYIDFASEQSWIEKLDKYENLIVIQTLSKAYGLAGLRIGLGFCSEYIISLLNIVKPPYNISSTNQRIASEFLAKNIPGVSEIINERKKLESLLEIFEFVEVVYPSEANFLLVKMKDADDVFNYLKEKNIIIRNRSNVQKCNGCLRITIGTPEENDILLKSLKQYEESVVY